MGVFDLSFVQEHLKVEDYPICVETGTGLGYSTVELQKLFQKVFTIEIDQELWQDASRVFAEASNVVCIEGDSSEQLSLLLTTLQAPTIFYLDAHWSGDARVDWEASAWQGYAKPTSHRRVKESNELPSPQEQSPLLEEVTSILSFPHACAIYVDDLDKFAPDGKGKVDTGFKGEDWSHLDWNAIIDLCRPRLKAQYYKGGEQALLVFDALDASQDN